MEGSIIVGTGIKDIHQSGNRKGARDDIEQEAIGLRVRVGKMMRPAHRSTTVTSIRSSTPHSVRDRGRVGRGAKFKLDVWLELDSGVRTPDAGEVERDESSSDDGHRTFGGGDARRLNHDDEVGRIGFDGLER